MRAISRVLRGFLVVLSFLTRLPVGVEHNINLVADYCFFFPVVGLFIGFLTGLFSFCLYLLSIPPLLNGFLTLAFLMVLTGLQHVDGLIDFLEGLLTPGSPEKKLKVMHDVHVGVYGLAMGVVLLCATACSLALFTGFRAVKVLPVAEATAKTSILLCALLGKPAETPMAVSYTHLTLPTN